MRGELEERHRKTKAMKRYLCVAIILAVVVVLLLISTVMGNYSMNGVILDKAKTLA